MKSLFLSLFILHSLFSFSAVYEWKGTTQNYQLATNWLPERTEKKSSDTLVFAENARVENLVSETVAVVFVGKSLEISANKSVKLDIIYQLNIASDGILHIKGDEVIELNLLFSAKARIQGTLIFDGNKDLNHRLLGETKESIVFEPLSICEIRNLNGNVFGDRGTKDVVIFRNGAMYLAKDGGNPFGFAAPNSKVIFEKNSLFLHQYSSPLSLGGRNYGKLWINHQGNIAINFGSELSTTIEELNIQQGNVRIETPANERGLDLVIKKMIVAEKASFLYNPSKVSIIQIGGVLFPKNCTFGEKVTLQISSDSLVLQENLTIIGQLKLAGKVYTNSFLLTLQNQNENALSVQNGWIIGKFIRYISSTGTYLFPIGDSKSAQSFSLKTNQLQGVRYLQSEFVNTLLQLSDNRIEGLDNVEEFLTSGFWKIEPNQQPISGTYDLTLMAQNFSNSLDGKDVRIVKRSDESESWKPLGVFESSLYKDNMLSVRNVAYTSFSHFGIVVGESVILPIILKSFFAKKNDSELSFHWEMYEEEDGFYTLKQSKDGQHYEVITDVLATNEKSYHYRISAEMDYCYFQLYANGQLLKTIYVAPIYTFVIYPNPSNEEAMLVFDKMIEKEEIFIVDMLGREVWKETIEGVRVFKLPNLEAGIYFVRNAENILRWEVLK